MQVDNAFIYCNLCYCLPHVFKLTRYYYCYYYHYYHYYCYYYYYYSYYSGYSFAETRIISSFLIQMQLIGKQTTVILCRQIMVT